MVRDELMPCCRTCAGCPSASTASSPLTGRGELRIRTVDRRGRPARSCARSSTAPCSAASGPPSSWSPACCSSRADPGPLVAERTGLFEVFGYGGLLAGAVLLLRVVAAVARDGTT